MYLGIDLGTSGIKLVVLDDGLAQLGAVTEPLTVQSPADYWSEQHPHAWWDALGRALAKLRATLAKPAALKQLRAIGLSGQMHGAVIMNDKRRILRPAILWNDGRSHRQCAELARRVPAVGELAGVPPLPGFTAPKIMWLKENEPDVYAQIGHVLLPKDYLGMKLHGQLATDYSDAAGTLWLEQQSRTWSQQLCAAADTELKWLPELLPGSSSAGALGAAAAAQLGLPAGIPIAAGGGDAAAGAVSVGATADGASFISLGTSGQLFVATDAYRPNPAQMVHAFAHCVPDMWFQMAAMLNGARPLSWFAEVAGAPIPQLLAEAQRCDRRRVPLFLPYLTGERSPLGDPHIRGAFYGLDNGTGRAGMMCAVVEAVALCFADAAAAFAATGTGLGQPLAIGGGAQSNFVLQTLADATGLTVRRGAGAATGPAFGAAKLAAVAAGRLAAADLAAAAPTADAFAPDPQHHERLQLRLGEFRALYRALKPLRSVN